MKTPRLVRRTCAALTAAALGMAAPGPANAGATDEITVLRHTTMPLRGYGTVLAAWCELREDFRQFRTDRIAACHETGDGFADPAPQLRRDWRVE